MSKFVVEYKKKDAAGFTHARKVIEPASGVEGQNQIAELFNSAFDNSGSDSIEFFSVRLLKEKKPVEPKPKVVSKS